MQREKIAAFPGDTQERHLFSSKESGLSYSTHPIQDVSGLSRPLYVKAKRSSHEHSFSVETEAVSVEVPLF